MTSFFSVSTQQPLSSRLTSSTLPTLPGKAELIYSRFHLVITWLSLARAGLHTPQWTNHYGQGDGLCWLIRPGSRCSLDLEKRVSPFQPQGLRLTDDWRGNGCWAGKTHKGKTRCHSHLLLPRLPTPAWTGVPPLFSWHLKQIPFRVSITLTTFLHLCVCFLLLDRLIPWGQRLCLSLRQ